MYPLGHVGVTLLLFAPISYLLFAVGRERRVFEWLTALVVLSLVPDVDAVLPGVVHRGMAHTLLAAAVLGVVMAAVGWRGELSPTRTRTERAPP